MPDDSIFQRITPEVRRKLQELRLKATLKIVYAVQSKVVLQDWRAFCTPTIATFAEYGKAQADAAWITAITSAAEYLLSDAESLEKALNKISELEQKLEECAAL